MNPVEILPAIAAQVIWRRRMAWTIAVLAAGAASAAVAVRLDLPAWIIAVAALAVAAVGTYMARRRPVSPDVIAAHFDRTVPSLEESSALLLRRDGSVLERLQRRRVAAVVATMGVPPLPVPGLRVAATIAGGFALIGVAAVAVPREPGPPAALRRGVMPEAAKPLVIASAELSWRPPAYTGRRGGVASSPNVAVEEGSILTWSVVAPRASQVDVVTSRGDTMPATRVGDGRWVARATLERSTLWHARAIRAADSVRSADHIVTMIADRPPLLSVIAPPSRSAIEWREPHVVDIRGLVSDDFGIVSMRLIATVASGRGEGVRFRERTFDVEIESRRSATSMVIGRRVLLDSLAVEPGDEVLLAFEAADNRAPGAQTARSETIFISLLDTLETAGAELPGISLRAEPAFFRSQRQIIIDTETLLRDIRQRNGGDTLRRSMDIGHDQYLLRLRYGELVGEETSGASEDPDSDAPVTAEDFRHDHDMAENATLLGASVKALLKRAVAAMWESERHLRIGNPTAALPFEYRALESLEEIRRASRAYVKRIGFEPPAIDVDKVRLTRDARGLARSDLDRPGFRPDDDAPLRAAIAALESRDRGLRAAALEDAAARLAQRAVESVRGEHLETLGLIRRVLDGCDSCTGDLRSGLLAALPRPGPPFVPRRPTSGALHR